MNTPWLRRWMRQVRRPLDRQHAFRRIRAFHARPRALGEIVDHALDLGTRGAYRVTSVQKRSEITALAEQVAALEPRVVLEIGTHRGGTLFLWAQLARAQVITLDVVDLTDRAPLFRAFPLPDSAVKIHALCGDSHHPETRRAIVELLAERPVDFLFLDGDHTEAGVEADHRDYGPLVRPGGLIAFHDIAGEQRIPTNQVQHFWRRLKNEAGDVEALTEFLDAPDQIGYGIGVLRVEG